MGMGPSEGKKILYEVAFLYEWNRKPQKIAVEKMLLQKLFYLIVPRYPAILANPL